MSYSNFNTLVERLVDARVRSGMSRYALARELDVSYQHLSRFERKEVRSSVILVDYMFFLHSVGVSPDYLVTGGGFSDWDAVSANVSALLSERKRTRRCVGNVSEDFII